MHLGHAMVQEIYSIVGSDNSEAVPSCIFWFTPISIIPTALLSLISFIHHRRCTILETDSVLK
jgi:hypothetical protein